MYSLLAPGLCQPVRRKGQQITLFSPKPTVGRGHLGSLLWFWANPFHGKSRQGGISSGLAAH